MNSRNILELKEVDSFVLPILEPFNFRYTFWKPSHFETGLEAHTQDAFWRTFRFDEAVCGVRTEPLPGKVHVTVFGTTWTPDLRHGIRGRLTYSYGLTEDIRPFLDLALANQETRVAAEALLGMRSSCPESVFEIAIIAFLLQNVTIGRTVTMYNKLMELCGQKVAFDGQTLNAIFSPSRLKGISENELREKARVGYRAKYFNTFSEFFAHRSDLEFRKLGYDKMTHALNTVKGVGPYTSRVIMSAAMRDH